MCGHRRGPEPFLQWDSPSSRSFLRLNRAKFMFFRDALVWFAVALEAVLEFAVAFGKLRQNFITA